MKSIRFTNKVIVRRGKKYWIGSVKRMKFIKEEDLISLDILDKLELRYIPLEEYVKISGYDATKKIVNELRKKIGYTEIWVFDPLLVVNKTTKNIPEKKWLSYWYKNINVRCQKCVHECKQSSRVTLLSCPTYKEE